MIYKICMVLSAETIDFFCPNELCNDYGERGLGNIAVFNRYGRDGRRLLRCKTCNFKFSERRNSFFLAFIQRRAKYRRSYNIYSTARVSGRLLPPPA